MEKERKATALWVGIGALLVVGLVVIGYVVFKPKPHRNQAVWDLKESALHQFKEYFSRFNQEYDRARDITYRWYYNTQFQKPFPLDAEGRAFFRPHEPLPVFQHLDRYEFDPGAIVILDLPIPQILRRFDTSYGKITGDRLVDHPANFRPSEQVYGLMEPSGNFSVSFYFVPRDPPLASSYYYFDSRTGYAFAGGSTDAQGRQTDPTSVAKNLPLPPVSHLPVLRFTKPAPREWIEEDGRKIPPPPDEIAEDERKALEDFRKKIAEQFGPYGLAEAATRAGKPIDQYLQAKILPAVEIEILWPEDVNETPEPERIPIGCKGVLRYQKIRYVWDEAARVHRYRPMESQPILRHEKTSTPKELDNNQWQEGMLVWRPEETRLEEAKFEFLGGNLKVESPTTLQILDKGAYDKNLLAKAEETVLKEETERVKKVRAREEEKRRRERERLGLPPVEERPAENSKPEGEKREPAPPEKE